jgi:hypothetical protein
MGMTAMNARHVVTSLFAGAFLALSAAPGSAQIGDERWLPFIGCWEPAIEDEVDAGLLCFRPTDDGVEMTNVANGSVLATEVLVADGVLRPVVAEGCEGTESVTFSADGRRAFTRSDITCGNDSRSGTGVMALTAPTRWIDVRALPIQGEMVSWVQEYQLVGFDRLEAEGLTDPAAELRTTVRAARVAATSDLDIEDVREAATLLDTEAVVAWVAAQGEPFDLDGETLLALSDEGMSEEVIDVMVAVSNPDRFVVSPEQRIDEVEPRDQVGGRRIPVFSGYRSYLAWDPFYSGYYGFGFGYSPWGYGYGYPGWGYSPWGSRYGYGWGPTVIRIERAGSGGRVVNGRGWLPGSQVDSNRRARPRSSVAPRSRGAPRSSVGPSRSRGSGGSGSAVRRSGSSGSQPARSGGRTARRRGGG